MKKNELEVRRKESEELVISSDGRNHQIKAKGDAAKGLTVAVSTIAAFTLGYLLSRRG